jgi:hypothetical protein
MGKRGRVESPVSVLGRSRVMVSKLGVVIQCATTVLFRQSVVMDKGVKEGWSGFTVFVFGGAILISFAE